MAVEGAATVVQHRVGLAGRIQARWLATEAGGFATGEGELSAMVPAWWKSFGLFSMAALGGGRLSMAAGGVGLCWRHDH